MMQRKFTNDHMEIWIEDGIFFVTFKSEALTLDIVRTGVEERLKLFGDESFPMLSDIRMVKKVNKEARAYLGSEEGSRQLLAGAMLVKTIFQETAGNIFINFNRPLVPAKLFRNQKDALAWLNGFKPSTPIKQTVQKF